MKDFRGFLSRFSARFMISAWVTTWILCAVVAPHLFDASPQIVRAVCAGGFIGGSILGNSLFVPLAIKQDMQALAAVIASGIFAVFLMGLGFIYLFWQNPTTASGPGSAGFYTFLLPSAVIWLSGGAYLAVSRFYPEMRDVRLSLRPWVSPRTANIPAGVEEKLSRVEEKQDADLEQQERIIEKLEDLETKVEGDERRKNAD